MFPNWLVCVPGLRTALSRRDRRPKAPPPRRPPLRVEALEDRSVPATFLVTSNLDDVSAGTLRWAIDQANSLAGPDVIEFDAEPGHLFANPQTITDSGLPLIADDVKIVGAGTDRLKVSGPWAFVVSSGVTFSVSGMTIADGNAPFGSGIDSIYSGGTVTVADCVFTGNHARGAAAINNGGTMTISNCTFSANVNDDAGAAGVVASGGQLTVTDCIFTGNTGGGIENVGTLTVSGSTFTGNRGADLATLSVRGETDIVQYGSGIYNTYAGTANVRDCIFSDNFGTAVFNYHDPALPSSYIPTVTVRDSTFSRNQGRYGGGMTDQGGAAEVDHCTFSGNSASGLALSGGGGLNVSEGGTLVLSNSTFSGNYAGYNLAGAYLGGGGYGGGASVTVGSTATVTNCTFSGNHAYSTAGGLYVHQTTMTVSGCTFSGNSAMLTSGAGGGGISNAGGSHLAVVNSTFSGNHAINGGGIRNATGSFLTVANSTFAGNSADFNGGGIANWFNGTMEAIANTLVAGNTAPTAPDFFGSGAVTSHGSNLIGDGRDSGFTDGTNGDQVGSTSNPINPMLAPLGNYGGPTQTMPLLPGSPAIDAGDNALAVGADGNPLTSDQRGLPRMVGASVDIGAVEDQMLAGPGTDGISDSGQVNVTIVPNAATGAAITLESPLGTNLAAISLIDPPPGLPKGAKTPVGTFDLRVGGVAPGGTTTVTLLMPTGAKVNQYWKYGPSGWFNFTSDGTTGAKFQDVNGDGTKDIILTFIDGGRGDEDGTANSIVVDPGAPVFVPIQVQIDVRSAVNLSSQGVIAAAILSTADFDAATVDAATVRFAGAAAVQWFLQDVDGDGRLDLVLNFRTQDTDLRAVYAQLLADDIDTDGVLDSTHQEASVGLTGSTTDGQQVEGSDTLDLFLSGKALRDLLGQLAAAGAI